MRERRERIGEERGEDWSEERDENREKEESGEREERGETHRTTGAATAELHT